MVADEGPLTDPVHYITAVRDALEAAGITTTGIGGLPYWAKTTGRSLSIGIEFLLLGPDDEDDDAGDVSGFHERDRFENTVSLTLEWQETRGWYFHDTFEPGAVRGQAHRYSGLGLGIVPEPALVAERAAEVLLRSDDDIPDRRHTERKIGPYDAELEDQLAAYLPASPET